MKGKAKGLEERRAYWTLVLPAFLAYLLVMAFPIVLSLTLSLSDYNGGRMFGGKPWGLVGLRHYAAVLGDAAFWHALGNNAYIVLISVFGQLPLGFVFAYVIYRKLVKWPDFWQGILYLPNIISVIVIGILWQTIFSPYGPLAEAMNGVIRGNFQASLARVAEASGGTLATEGAARALLELAGPAGAAMFSDPVSELVELVGSYGPGVGPELLNDLTNLFAPVWAPDFLSKPGLAMLPILFVILWMYTGMYLILFLANMQKIDTQIVESARIDGANEMQVMRHIILPSLSGTFVNSAILAIAGSLSSFGLVFAMTGGGPGHVTEILAIYMFNKAFQGSPDFPVANAIALLMVLISFALITVTKALEKRFGGKE